jgi:hypothetical protein
MNDPMSYADRFDRLRDQMRRMQRRGVLPAGAARAALAAFDPDLACRYFVSPAPNQSRRRDPARVRLIQVRHVERLIEIRSAHPDCVAYLREELASL